MTSIEQEEAEIQWEQEQRKIREEEAFE